MSTTNALLDDLAARGLIHDLTDRDALAERLASGPVTLYCGFDPTADSLHVGHLLGLLGLRRFALAGHHPLALVGGATGMIGDPSGRSSERNLLTPEQLEANKSAIAGQIDALMGADLAWELVDNAAWTADLSLLDFLRDVGKHATVNQMIARESVKGRMDGANGISFTEFSYQLLQAHDFWWLSEHRGCVLQVGGSDQWGNIVAGIDLIRRRSGATAHGLTWPLLLRTDGTKFGKSAAGETIWLDPVRTTPYRFYQFFVNAEDADVPQLLHRLTLVPVPELTALLAAHRAAPRERTAQRRLAAEVTALVHGQAAADQARQASEVLFGGAVTAASSDALEMLIGEVPTWRVPRDELAGGVAMIDVLVRSGLCSSRKDARRTLDQGGGYCNDVRVDVETTFTTAELLHDRFALLRRGRKAYALVVADRPLDLEAGAGWV